tara:strand:+ start:189 stop:347 length:159 start_codon:yes stop_codon:yes gene_type:complete
MAYRQFNMGGILWQFAIPTGSAAAAPSGSLMMLFVPALPVPLVMPPRRALWS